MSISSVDAFNIGAGASASDLSWLIPAIIFAVLFTVFAYILIKMFDELKKGDLTLAKYFQVVVRLFLLLAILGYFLLH